MSFLEYCLWCIETEMRTWPDEGVDDTEVKKRVARLRPHVEQLVERTERIAHAQGVEEGFQRAAKVAEETF
jgi:hypothetical protein